MTTSTGVQGQVAADEAYHRKQTGDRDRQNLSGAVQMVDLRDSVRTERHAGSVSAAGGIIREDVRRQWR